ncbi:hypothetical protein BJX65DRAFT_260775 [Aspergillus insuetus]
MSSLFLEVGTPCPRRSKNSTSGDFTGTGSDSFGLWDDSLGNCDDTKNIDFTTEIRAPILTGAKPKRRSKASTSFVIHSDHEENPTVIKQKRDIKPALSAANRKTSLLAQPAQRFRPRVSFAPSPIKHSQQRDNVEPTKRTTRPSVHKNNELLRRISGEGELELGKGGLKKDVRRNTVYVPPEDTTVVSVFMGLFSPLKSGNLNHTADITEINSLETQIAKKRQAEQRLTTSPGRVPLQNSSKALQESNGTFDIPGKNGGKENIPPGMVLVGAKGKNLPTTKYIESAADDLAALSLTDKDSRGILAPVKTVNKPLATKTVNIAVQKTKNRQDTLKLSARGGVDVKTGPNAGLKGTGRRTSTMSDPPSAPRSGMSSSISRNNSKHTKRDYALVLQGVTNPSMYDDNWLSHQEVILTQLINGLFDETNGITQADDPAFLRRELLLLYQSSPFTDLYKRLQSSLLYGALNIPKHVLAKNSRLRHDLGLKRKYIDIWLQTYDPKALKAALETVTGRIIPAFKPNISTLSANEGSPNVEKALRRRLEKFLSAYLLYNQDMDTSENSAEEPEALGNAYRRTALRSIMLVILLDKARLTPKISLPRCLFLASSPYKSSSAVLQALARFLLPSCGDINKALGQLNCQVSYQQHPLEEYEYEVFNLAVDLRDGIRLTRIVELLLYPYGARNNSSDGTLSEMRLFKNSAENSHWPLCCRLKFPCLSRTVKMFNTRVALDALASNKEGKLLLNNIRAEDIVNGHREKTIALLWGLVSKWGLSGFVDLSDLRQEITQLKQRTISLGPEPETHNDEINEHSENGEAAVLLKQWASLIARLHGLQPSVTTNRGDSRVYECILDEYEGYILSQNQFDLTNGYKASLEDRLRALGCSTQFIRLISPGLTPHILDTSSNTGALAFLYSCLLPATKRARAAIVLQNAWRRVLRHRENKQRIVARDIARQCAAIVQTRDRILWAKTIIVHWWRVNKSRRRRKTLRATATRRVTHERKFLVTKTTTTRIPLHRGK